MQVYVLDARGLAQAAQRLGSAPYPGAGVAFLNNGAKRACQDFGIGYNVSNAKRNPRPDEVELEIDERYYSPARPHAGT